MSDSQVASQVAATVDEHLLEDKPNMPPIELASDKTPEWLAKQNWSVNSTARLFHCFAEAQVQRFTVGKDVCANRAELNAGQTLHDSFWSIVYWLYNYGYVSTC